MASSLRKAVSKAAKAVRAKVGPKRPSKLKTAAKVAGVTAALVGAGLATRAIMNKSGKSKSRKRK